MQYLVVYTFSATDVFTMHAPGKCYLYPRDNYYKFRLPCLFIRYGNIVSFSDTSYKPNCM